MLDRSKKASHPSSSDPGADLSLLPAHQQIELFKTKRLSPLDVLKAQIARIERHEPVINACTFRHFDAALAAAERSEVRYRSGDARPLEGITVAIKDEYDRAGWTVTAGSKVREHHTSEENHPVVDKLIEAGAVLHVQTTAPEYYLVAVTWSDLWGVTRNPWNPECTPGGSSGGSAAALAAGMATLAIGSDMGGSIRIPCALNGLYGSKPAYGRIASPDPSALVPHASPGPLARDFRDLILLQNVISGPAPRCPAVLRPKLELPLEYPRRTRRLAFSIDQGWASIEPDVRANVHAAAHLFERAGYVVEEVDLALETTDAKMRETIEKALFSTALGADLLELAPERGRLTTYGRRFVELAREMGPAEAKQGAEEALRLYGIIDERVFGKGYDALITPTMATTQIGAAYDPTTDTPVINGRRVDPYSGWFLTSLFSLLNWMPVFNVPSGITSNNVPTGIQIASRPYDDVTAAEIAANYAQVAPALRFPEPPVAS
jgi:Asp-tRNA(Asn)/Glu-tRNA(Gln) amidotransferase A subunit family amidase